MMNDEVFEVMASMYAFIHRATVVTRREYEDLLSAACSLYRENNELRQRLAKLEELASSWSGNPQAHPVIVEARKSLTTRYRVPSFWMQGEE